ncbi:probable caffeoyl-CoA O-methyltransferase At4g26220 isoform X3 [Telopea speciosissima]|uniref:probable caffeoyl-CoA O-methyltransferase At4g26220 isoform X3 n=1 Tax=Telopea speciosissima TaxID=54955 RepID=UPI001CC5D62A|nr:probable caffeoyl-CoA O-methyltransferase At4g26220 isoform X3 [Telopea speciosissima]
MSMTRPFLYGSANLMRTLHPLMSPNLVSIQFQPTLLGSTVKLHFSTITSIFKASRRCCGAVRVSKLHQPRSCYTDTVIVAKDGKYGNKQIISVTPQLYDYMLANVREPEILRELREETASMRGSQMQVSPDQAQLLAMLVQILGAQRCIEVGVYTVDVRHALAADTLRSLIMNGEACSYDFAFVDAEKRMYHEYFELLLQLVRVGGVIVVDNVLWHGKVADPLVNDPKTSSIREFNKNIMEDSRVSISMVPIGDGMTICRKL